jgi:macrolide transport system ATP-binding/permease protein
VSHSPALHAHDLTFGYGERILFDGVSLRATPGQRVGLVGENGVGKSTLLRLLAGTERPHGGCVCRGEDVGFLAQELPFAPGARVREVLDDALARFTTASDRLDRLAEALANDPEDGVLLDEYGRVLEWAQAHDLWDARRRAELVYDGLGLGGIDQDRSLDTLSGGQRSRLGLAALLIRRPATLLLDEPTNHLDDEAMALLERQLVGLPGVVVLSSHDRVFLDAVCTDIVDLDPALGGPTRYGGSYSAYLSQKRAERARWEQRHAAEQDELEQLRETVRTSARAVAHDRAPRDNAKMLYDFKAGRVQKQISRRVRNARLRLDELERSQVRKPPEPLRFRGSLTADVATDSVAVRMRHVALPGRLRVEHLDISTTARLLVTGGNGAGKSTLLAVVAGLLRPPTGEVRRARGVRVELLEQDVRFADPSRTARQLYTELAGERVPTLAELGLLPPRDLDRPVGALSVGQCRRLALATLIARPPELLLLDEPTNHISLTLAEELFDALDAAPGGVVVASHDRWLRRDWPGEHLHLHAGEVSTTQAS